MERAEVTFDDVAVYFTEEEWRSLQEEEKSLYKEVMSDNYQMILSLNRPDVITNIQLGCEPYVTTANAGTIRDSWQGEPLAASDRSILQKSIHKTSGAGSVLPLKRLRRYPRVNPFRWLKRYKKNKSRSRRACRRLEQRENGSDLESNETSPGRGDICTDQAGGAADSEETLSAPHTEGSSNPVQIIDRRADESAPHTKDGKRTRKADHKLQTMYITHTKNKPDLRVTLIISEEPRGAGDLCEVPADLGRDILHIAEAERAKSSSDVPPSPDEHNAENIGEHGHTQSYTEAAGPPKSASKTTGHLMDTRRSRNPNEEKLQEKALLDSVYKMMALPRRREKHVTFSDTVTTFIIEPEDDDGAMWQNKRHRGRLCFSKAAKSSSADKAYMVMKSQNSIPNAQPKATMIRDRGGNQDLSRLKSMKSNKKMEEAEGCPPTAKSGRDHIEPQLQPNSRDEEDLTVESWASKPNGEPKATMICDRGGNQDLSRLKSMKSNKKMEEAEGCPPSAESGRDHTEPQLQPNSRDEEDMAVECQNSIPNAVPKTTIIHDSGRNQDLSRLKSMKSNKKMEEAEGCPPSAESGRDHTEPQLQPNSRDEEDMAVECQNFIPNATQPEREATLVCDMLGGEERAIKSQNSMRCNNTIKKMKEVEGSPESGRHTAEPSPSTGPCPQPRKKDVGTQINPIRKEENHQPANEIELTPPHPANTDQNFVKSYYCSNCSKITHWTRLNEQQKADVENSFHHFCRKCSRQREKNKAAVSPHKGSSTANATPAKCASLGKAIVNGSPARKKPHCSLLAISPKAGPTAKKKQRNEVNGKAESARTSASHDIQLKKGQEASPRSSTSHNVQLEKGEEELQMTSNNDNVQLRKGEDASPRSSTSPNIQLKKGEDTSHRSSTSPDVQLKKGKDTSPRSSTNLNDQLKKGEEASHRSSTSPNIQLKKGEEASPRSSTSPNIQLKKGEDASHSSSTSPDVQLKKGKDTSPRSSTNLNDQLKKGEDASHRSSTSPDVQLKKGEDASHRSSVNHNVQLFKGEELLGTPVNRIVQLQNNEEEFSRSLTNFQVQLKKHADHKKKRLAAQNIDRDNQSNLCGDCGHFEASEDAKLHQQVKVINGTPNKSASTNVFSLADLKNYTPDKKKSNKTLQKEASSVQEEKGASDSRSSHGTISPQDQRDGAQTRNMMKHDVCIKCGKLFLKGQKTKPLTNIQQKKPVWGGSTVSTEQIQKTGSRSNAVGKERVKKSPGEPKEKKPRKAKDPKSPRPPRGSRDKSLCTKCGKRLALHVEPSQEGPNEAGNDENECVVLPRKKRKRPLAGMEPFTCTECGKIFTRHFTLLQHRLIHTGERPYSCKVCKKTFRDSSYLIVHMRSHTKEKPYSCAHCGKCFSQNSALHVHLRIHTAERPFQCQDCGKNFTDRSTYRHHHRIHTGEKPYACSYCGKKFTQQPHMKRHETIHTGERPFECTQCGKRFIERTKLKKHELVHQKGKS